MDRPRRWLRGWAPSVPSSQVPSHLSPLLSVLGLCLPVRPLSINPAVFSWPGPSQGTRAKGHFIVILFRKPHSGPHFSMCTATGLEVAWCPGLSTC